MSMGKHQSPQRSHEAVCAYPRAASLSPKGDAMDWKLPWLVTMKRRFPVKDMTRSDK